jgi:hypothetical protein
MLVYAIYLNNQQDRDDLNDVVEEIPLTLHTTKKGAEKEILRLLDGKENLKSFLTGYRGGQTTMLPLYFIKPMEAYE